MTRDGREISLRNVGIHAVAREPSAESTAEDAGAMRGCGRRRRESLWRLAQAHNRRRERDCRIGCEHHTHGVGSLAEGATGALPVGPVAIVSTLPAC